MENTVQKYERAAKRVKELKGFYNHIKIFVVFNGFLYLIRSGFLHQFLADDFPIRPEYFEWVHTNVLIWGLILVAHALITYRNKFSFYKKWEARQIQKYLEKEEQENKKYR